MRTKLALRSAKLLLGLGIDLSLPNTKAEVSDMMLALQLLILPTLRLKIKEKVHSSSISRFSMIHLQ